MVGNWRRVAPAAATTVLLWGCQTPAVDTDAPDYSTSGYVYDVGLCNAADLVRNTAEGSVEIVAGMAAGFIYGAAVVARDARHDEALAVLGGGLIGSVGGAGYGLYKAVEQVDLTVDACLEREGFTLADGTAHRPI